MFGVRPHLVLRVKNCASPLRIIWTNGNTWVTSCPTHVEYLKPWVFHNVDCFWGTLNLRRASVQLDQATVVYCLPLSSETPEVLGLCAVSVARFAYPILVRTHATAKISCCSHLTTSWCKCFMWHLWNTRLWSQLKLRRVLLLLIFLWLGGTEFWQLCCTGIYAGLKPAS